MKIHVLHVLNSAHGGSALSTFELIEELKLHGVASSLVCFNNADSRTQEQIAKLVEGRALFIPLYWMNKRIRASVWKRPVIEVLSFIKTWRGYRYQRKITRLINENKITLIHTSTILNPEGAIAAKRNKLPHAWHVRELIGPGMHFQFPHFKRTISYISNNCDVLIANSRVTEACLCQYFPRDKVRYIPNGIRVDRFAVKKHERKEKVVIGMVGSVTSKWKNHALFLKIASHVVHDKTFEFRIYGSLPSESDPYYAELLTFSRTHHLTSTLRFVDFVRDPAEIMREIDILFHPAGFESFGRIFAEAMAAGIPVLGIKEGGALELISDGENGYLVDDNDIEDIVSKIRSLKDNVELRNQFGARGRKMAEEQYTLSLLGKRILNLYVGLQ